MFDRDAVEFYGLLVVSFLSVGSMVCTSGLFHGCDFGG